MHVPCALRRQAFAKACEPGVLFRIDSKCCAEGLGGEKRGVWCGKAYAGVTLE